MKKLYIILSFIALNIYSSDIAQIKTQIILNIAHLLTHKNPIKVFIDDDNFKDIFQYSKNIKQIDSSCKADLIITNNSNKIKKLCKRKNLNIISTSYKDYKSNKNIDFGAFFWQKGRPNMLINSKIVEKRDISIPKSYYKYLD